VQRGNTGQMPVTPQERSPVQRGNTSQMPVTPQERSPVLRGNTSQMPVTPQERSPVLPKTPPTHVPSSPLPSFSTASPDQAPDVNASLPRPAGLNPADSGLRKINLDESMLTTPHRVIRSNSSQPVPAEWQIVPSGPLNGQSTQMGAVNAPGFPDRNGDTLQSLAALKKAGAPAPVSSAQSPAPAASMMPAPGVQGVPAAGLSGPGAVPARPTPPIHVPGETARTSAPGRRNYPALVAALQTPGYSVPGFIASAVIGLDGVPIAQVAVDDKDISPLCAYLSTVLEGAGQALGSERGGACEHIVIASSTQQILLRALSTKKDIFQVLITTRETSPAESLEVLANVESALIGAL
jgi:predicted regulator of Ras-like GTPase activity (Roadblock/LC7/MglB family)